ncbi:hypothetical protein CCP2SC5_1150002 [Azospirillaceae bacterium]
MEIGEAVGDVNEQTLRRIQIREAIRAHFEKERRLLSQGVKVLTLFFIDEVAKYRDYKQPDEKGDYARMFEEEYEVQKSALLAELPLEGKKWQRHLTRFETSSLHNGYFSIDKKTKRLSDPDIVKRGEDK